MKRWRKTLHYLLSFCVLFAYFSIEASAQDGLKEIPSLTGLIVDETKWLSSQELLSLQKNLKGIKLEGNVQVAVLITNSTSPEEIRQYSIRVAEKWKVGKKGSDNGVLIVIAREDHKSSIDIGYGLEGTIPDLIAKRIIDESLTPALKRNNPYHGITSALEQIKKRVNSEAVTHGMENKKNIDNSTIEIPFFNELTDAGKIITMILGVVGGIFLLIGIHGESFEAFLLGICIPFFGGIVIGLIFFTAQLLILCAVSVIIAVMVGIGITFGFATVSGGDFGGGGASG